MGCGWFATGLEGVMDSLIQPVLSDEELLAKCRQVLPIFIVAYFLESIEILFGGVLTGMRCAIAWRCLMDHTHCTSQTEGFDWMWVFNTL